MNRRNHSKTIAPASGCDESLDIAYISNVVYPFVKGGAEKRIHEIGKRLVEHGHQVTVYSRQWWDGPTNREHAGMSLRGVAPARELYTDDRRSISEALSFARALIGPLREHADEHDVLVVSVFPYFPVLTSVLSTLRINIPIVTTWHEVWDRYWLEYLGPLGVAGWGVEWITAHLPQHPIAVSELTARKLAKFGVSRDRVTVVPNGVHVDEISAVDPYPTGHEVLFVGRLIKEKNLDVAINAFDTVADAYDVSFGIIGEGPERTRLEELTKSIDHGNRVEFLGRIEEYSEVLARMKAAEVFVLPSTREGFGITLVEAMAAGCTVIAVEGDNTAAGEVIQEGGFTVPLTANAIGRQLEMVLDGKRPPTDPIRVARRFDWSKIAKMEEQHYQAAIAAQSNVI